LANYAATQGYTAVEIITDLGRGLNFGKRGLQRLIQLIRMICRREVGTLILTHKDRLLRFWAELIFALCALFGFRWVMIENQLETVEDRLAQDVIELPTVFPAGWTDAGRTGTRKR
jgi:predicted site-specific integrase-resolvase